MRALLGGTYGESVRQSLMNDGGLIWKGNTDGYRAFADHHSGQKLTMIFTANRLTGAADLLRRNVPKIAAGEVVPPPQIPKIQPMAAPFGLAARPPSGPRWREGERPGRQSLPGANRVLDGGAAPVVEFPRSAIRSGYRCRGDDDQTDDRHG